MRPWSLAMIALLVAALAACGSSDSDSTADATPDAAADTAPEAVPDLSDAREPDADAPDADLPDGTEPDAPGDATEPDAPDDAVAPEGTPEAVDATPEADAPETDTTAPTVFAAVPGARCAPSRRFARVQVYGSPWSPALDAQVEVNDRPDAWTPQAPALTDASCSFYEQAPPAFCGTCPTDTLCAPDATCQAKPAPIAGAVLTLTAGDQAQILETTGEPGGAWATLTLPGRTFAVLLTWGPNTLTLGATTVPEPVAGLTMKLEGAYDKPTSLDLTWTPPADPASVFTHIPINHHAAGPTYTECAVDAATGALHVDGAMLEPLAVITGLEFQGIEHARFAAAETPAGCVEVRFFVQQVPN